VTDGGQVARGFCDIYATYGTMTPGQPQAARASTTFAADVAHAAASSLGAGRFWAQEPWIEVPYRSGWVCRAAARSQRLVPFGDPGHARLSGQYSRKMAWHLAGRIPLMNLPEVTCRSQGRAHLVRTRSILVVRGARRWCTALCMDSRIAEFAKAALSHWHHRRCPWWPAVCHLS
jgi:hypothetical protein